MKKLTWETVTLKQYLQMQKVLEEGKGIEMDKAIEFLKILTGVDYSKRPIAEYMQSVKLLEFMKSDIPTVDMPDKMTINGRVYKINANVDNITTAQFMDYMTASKKEGNEKLIDVVSIFILPEEATGYGEGYDFDEVKKDVEDMPLLYANSIGFFLQRQTRKSLKRSLRYLLFQVLNLKGMSWKNKWKIISQMVGLWSDSESYRSSLKFANLPTTPLKK